MAGNYTQRDWEEDQLRKEKLKFLEAANRRREREQAQETIEIAGLAALGIIGVIGGVLWGLFGTKIGRIISLILLLAGGALYGVYWLQNDAAMRAQAQQPKQPQQIATPRAAADASSNADQANPEPAQQLAGLSSGDNQSAQAGQPVAGGQSPGNEGLSSARSKSTSPGTETQPQQPADAQKAVDASLALSAQIARAVHQSASSPGTQDVSSTASRDVGSPAAASAVVISASSVIQASFDCTNASSKIEKLICSTPETADADRRLAAAYRSARAKSNVPNALKAEQRSWLMNERNNCSDAACLSKVTEERIQALAAM